MSLRADRTPSLARSPRRTGTYIVLSLVTACALAVASFWLTRPTRPSGPIARVRSLAVLPFQPLVVEKGEESLGLALADAIITRLSRVHGLVVRPTSAIRSFGGPSQDAVAAGRALHVDAVLDGRIQQSTGRVRITVQLVGVSQGVPLWSATFDVLREDLFSIEDSISEGVAAVLASRAEGDDREETHERGGL